MREKFLRQWLDDIYDTAVGDDFDDHHDDICLSTWHVPLDNDDHAGRLVPGTRPRHHSQTRFPGSLAVITKITTFVITIVVIRSPSMPSVRLSLCMSQPESLGCTDKCTIKKITFSIIKIIIFTTIIKTILYEPT